MDFHGFARKELQTLCKLNKIPANMTNVAMANALSSLDHVEGLGEIMEQRSKESVDVGSPEVPRTVTGTLTRRKKQPGNVFESGGVVASSRARGRTSMKIGDGDSVEELNGVEKTLVMASGRTRGGGVASSRKKVEVPSVQRVYSTRRSVSLVEKELSELCLRNSVRRARRPIKINDELSSEVHISTVKGGQAVDAVQESEDLNGGLADVASPDEVAKALSDVQGNKVPTYGLEEVEKPSSDDCEKEVVGAIDNVATKIVLEIDVPEVKVPNSGFKDAEKTSEAFAKDLTSMDSVDDVAAFEEVEKAKSEEFVKNFMSAEKESASMDTVVGSERVDKAVSEDSAKDIVGSENSSASMADVFLNEGVDEAIFKDCADIVEDVAGVMDNADYGVKESGIMALAAVEGAVKAISEDIPDVVDTLDYAADGCESTGSTDAAAVDEVDEEVMPSSVVLEAEWVTSVTIAEPELAVSEVPKANAVADHVPYLLIRKDTEFDLAGDHPVDMQEASFKSSADCEQADNEVTATGIDAVNHDADVSTFGDFEVMSGLKNASMEEVASQTPQPVSTTNGSNSHFKGERSMKKNVIKELPLVAEGMNKENTASTIKREESLKTSTPYNKMSMRKLLKTFKKMTINKTTEEYADADNHNAKQQQAVTSRKALQIIPDNAQKQ